jgi:multidrug efflux system membrane fusion protein
MTLLFPLLLLGCGRGEAEKGEAPKAPPAPVVVAEAVEQDVPLGLSAIGTVEAINTVEVRARIGGELSRVAFERGADVRKGELLFVIDPRPYEAALREAEADSARDEARAVSGDATARRYSELVEKGYVTRQQFDEAVADAEALKAVVRADRAALERARLDLEFCSIRAPISGRAGDLLVQPGNLIRANDDDPLVVIHQVSPVFVSFSLPERNLPEIRKHAAEGTLRVRAFLPTDPASSWEGSLAFIDNAVDGATGTILLKGTFPNEDRALWPGQFVDVELVLAVRRGAVVVPMEAVQVGQEGSFVYIVREDGTAEVRPVSPGPRAGDGIVIDEGLRPGEKVVVEGQLRLAPGAKVMIQPSGGAAGATAP